MKKIFCVLLIIITVFMCGSSVLTVNAETFYCPTHNENHNTDDLGVIEKFSFDISQMIYGGQLFFEDGKVVENDGYITTAELLAFNVSSKEFSKLWGIGKDIYNILKQIGIMLLCVYVLIEAMQKSMNDFSNAEFLFKCFIKLGIGVIIINNGYEIATYILNIGSEVFKLIANELGGFNSVSKGYGICEFKEIQDMGDWLSLLYIFAYFIPWLALSVARIVAYVICWIRIFDILMRVMFAPIGMADIMLGGLDSQGFRYLKKLGASALQGAIILAIVQAQSIVQNAMYNVNSIILMTLIPCLAITLICKSNQIASEVIGA